MREQIGYYLAAILLLPFFPLLLLQGYLLKRKIPSLPEAKGPLNGDVPGESPVMSILAVGESTFAGVGIDSQQEGITRAMANQLHQLTQQQIAWDVVAKSGYNAQKARRRLVPAIKEKAYDLIVIGLGGNDTFELNRPLRWKRHMKRLILDLRAQFPNSKIVIANLPPVGHFPAFPLTFRWILGGLVRLHASVIRRLPEEIPDTYFMREAITFQQWAHKVDGHYKIDAFFSDGVHPSALTYQLWGEDIAAYCYEEVLTTS
jgi:lysophospholipase L1-like esterase